MSANGGGGPVHVPTAQPAVPEKVRLRKERFMGSSEEDRAGRGGFKMGGVDLGGNHGFWDPISLFLT